MTFRLLAPALVSATLVACVPTPTVPDDIGNPGGPDAALPDEDGGGGGGEADGGLLGPPWNLVWQDEFDGEAGTPPDAKKWRHDVGGDGWGNGQLEFDTDRTENAALDGQGHLAIVARREDYGGRLYTSARLNTAGRFARAYGRFEVRLKQPKGQGMWPAFWLLGNNIGQAGWPDCGEIDVMEYRGQLPQVIRGSLHGPGYSGGGNHGREMDAGKDLSTDFHTYAVEWDPGRVVWKLDEKVYFTATPSDLPDGTNWVYDHDFFVILNLAVGGYFVGNPSPSTIFPQTMLVDHVRVYERLP